MDHLQAIKSKLATFKTGAFHALPNFKLVNFENK